ncbi:hypothetical protein DL98DRAFT_9020 [Cadophora sp. DSE1049]|nr:hypothetical protein DL98DRAFT_9020 [Cadophora sp. DSE1049]
MGYEAYHVYDASHMYQDNYNMENGGEVWYATRAVPMDPARASSRRQSHLSSQDYHSELDSIDEYAPGHGLMRAYSHAPPRTKNFVAPPPPQMTEVYSGLIINGARHVNQGTPLMEAIDKAVDRLAPTNTEIGSNWPYADSRFCPVQDADFSVNSDA